MTALLETVKGINACFSDYVLTLILLLLGLVFTGETRLVQLRCFPQAVSETLKSAFKDKDKGEITSFQALTTAVAAQVGTGNLSGACTAIALGGPGALFWMWLSAFLGMATIYGEAVLAQKTRKTTPEGELMGGPVCYITKALPGPMGKALSGVFALGVIVALGFSGTMVQTNALAVSWHNAFGTSEIIIAVVTAAAAGTVFSGGIKRLTKVSQLLVPLMAVIYIGGCLSVLIFNIKYLPESIRSIFVCAFRPEAITGGSYGYAMKTVITQGVKRGLFSNEAGMGSTAHAHALADCKSPHHQGMTAMLGVFIDSFLVLTLTGLTVVTHCLSRGVDMADIDGENILQAAFSVSFASKSGIFIACCLLCFAFSSVISWNCFGRINALYLFGKKGADIFTVLSLIFIFLGCCLSNEFVRELSDFFNQLMVIPNAIALFMLRKDVAKTAKN